ncbi:MAG: DNA-processing protein DprA [Muribaculaceae bacterium]|nr:DNA-processing protein DprA [Muribaculaceae bacterium]
MPVSDDLYRLAVSMIPGFSAGLLLSLYEEGISPEQLIECNNSELESLCEESVSIPNHSIRLEAMQRAREEERFISQHSISVRFLGTSDYPLRLAQLPDAPLALFVYGDADLDATRIVGLVGTRKCSRYGLSFCKTFVDELAGVHKDCAIISGLAYGIDAAGHSAALENGMPTVAVMAHGLDMIYPAAHRQLANKIVKSGGAIVTEYPSGTRPLKQRFLERNRIVAGLSDAIVVAESEIKGGAMSTANLACQYDRTVFAVPGRCTDLSSSGCNRLIYLNKALIYTGIKDFLSELGWQSKVPGPAVKTPVLFPELEGDCAKVFQLLSSEKRPMTLDEIHLITGIPMSMLMSAISELEFDGIISRLPGARFECAT